MGLELGEPPHDFDRLLAQVPAEHRGALFVLMSPVLYQSRARLADAAIRHGIPAVAGLRAFAEANAFMSYGPSIEALFRRAAEYVDRIYKGAKPADLPIEQPTKFELVINLKAAKALELSFPPTLLATADEVIE